eukprot:268969-Prorocentrum_minimum.AAC.1
MHVKNSTVAVGDIVEELFYDSIGRRWLTKSRKLVGGAHSKSTVAVGDEFYEKSTVSRGPFSGPTPGLV